MNNIFKNFFKRFSINFPIFFVILLLFIFPIISMVIISFKHTLFGNAYNYIFNYENFLKIFVNSLFISISAVFISLIVGYIIALWINSISNENTKKSLILLILLPLLINSLIKVLLLRSILVEFNLSGTYFGVIIGMAFLYLPFMIICIYNSLRHIDKEIIISSYNLGANKFQTFVKIIFPLSLSGIISGSLLVFLSSLTTVIVPEIIGDNKINNLGTLIVSIYSSGNFSYIAASSVIIILFMICSIFILQITKKTFSFKNKKEGKNEK